jgi:hypothetical protein
LIERVRLHKDALKKQNGRPRRQSSPTINQPSLKSVATEITLPCICPSQQVVTASKLTQRCSRESGVRHPPRSPKLLDIGCRFDKYQSFQPTASLPRAAKHGAFLEFQTRNQIRIAPPSHQPSRHASQAAPPIASAREYDNYSTLPHTSTLIIFKAKRKSFVTMSAAPSANAAANKGSTPDKNADATKDVKPAAALEEDDEFEDFPVESTYLLCCSQASPTEA